MQLGITFLTQRNVLIDQDYLLGTSHLPWIVALFVFLLCWQVMTMTMMLPASRSLRVSQMGLSCAGRFHDWLCHGVDRLCPPGFFSGYAYFFHETGSVRQKRSASSWAIFFKTVRSTVK